MKPYGDLDMQSRTPGAMPIKEMAAEMISATKAFIVRELKPLADRIAELEQREPVTGDKGDPGKDGKDGASVDFFAIVDAVVKRIAVPKDGRDGKDGKDAIARDGKDGLNGKDAEPIDEGKIIAEVAKRIPVPKDGKDGKDAIVDSVQIVADVLRLVPVPKDGERGKDGKDAPAIDEGRVVSEVLKAMPIPNDGRDGQDADPVDEQAIIAQVAKLMPIPKDGRDGKDGTAGTDGKSITIEDVTPVLESELSKWALDFERRASGVLERAVERMPRPRDGTDGKDAVPLDESKILSEVLKTFPTPKDGRDGSDGLGMDDFDVEYDGRRTFSFKWKNGEREKSRTFRAPVNIYCGVYKTEVTYEQDDSVTYGGSTWIATKDAPGLPGDGKDWRLCVKRGADGKDAR